ncbi:MAG: Hsp20/alpha crystallin family protein [Candidatus Omnitrophica bacterium]|nr:Hsp20/alpha crystallin family protein [Candidatus Omnitrophota bacterium]
MNLIKKRKNNWLYDPFSEIDDIQKGFDDFFGFPLSKLLGYETPAFAGLWVPAIDVHDEGDRYVVKAELPGMEKKNVQVSVNGNILSIKGEKKKDNKIKEEHCCRTERYYGSFQRNIRLANHVDIGKIKASFKDGVLELALPKNESAKLKSIDIE